MDKITIIIVNKTSLYLDRLYQNIKHQDYPFYDVIIFTEKKIDNDLILNDSNFTIIICDISFSKKYFLELLKSTTSQYFCFLQNEDVITYNKLSLQYKYLKEKNLNICSCLEESLLSPLDEPCQNSFISSEDIDFSCNSAFIALNPYTFMIKKSFLLNLYKILLKTLVLDELDFTLLLLKYTCIEKVPIKLYKFTKNIIPYEKNLHLSAKTDSHNPIYLFLKENFIGNRAYCFESLKLQAYKTHYNFTVLIIIEKLSLGGTETYILEMAKALKKLKIKTIILTVGGLLEDTFYLNSIKIIKNNDVFKNINCKDSLDTIIKFYKINIIHCHTPLSIKICKDVASSLPIFLTLHGTYYEKDLVYCAKNYITHFIFVSQVVKDFYFPNTESNKFHIIPNATLIEKDNDIDILKYHKLLGLSCEKQIFTYCSRLSNKKGKLAFKLLLSFKKALKHSNDIILIIAGNGPYFKELEDFAKEINIETTKVFLLKSVFDIKELARCSNLFIGTGRVALESLSVGTPTIAFGLSNCATFVTKNNLKELLKNNFNDHSLSTPNLDLIEDITLTNLLLNYITTPSLYNLNINLKDLNLSATAMSISFLYKNKSL